MWSIQYVGVDVEYQFDSTVSTLIYSGSRKGLVGRCN